MKEEIGRFFNNIKETIDESHIKHTKGKKYYFRSGKLMIPCPRCFDSDVKKINIINCEIVLWYDIEGEKNEKNKRSNGFR